MAAIIMESEVSFYLSISLPLVVRSTETFTESFQKPSMEECLRNDGIHRKSARPGTTSIHPLEICANIFIAALFIYMFEMGGILRELIRFAFAVYLLVQIVYKRGFHSSIFWSLCKLLLWNPKANFHTFSSFVLLAS